MTLKLGYVVSTLIFVAFFAITLAAQVKSSRYHPVFCWLVVVATTTVGTTASDMLNRTLELDCVKSSLIELALVVLVLVLWTDTELGIERGALVFAALLALVVAAGMVVLIATSSLRHRASDSPYAASH